MFGSKKKRERADEAMRVGQEEQLKAEAFFGGEEYLPAVEAIGKAIGAYEEAAKLSKGHARKEAASTLCWAKACVLKARAESALDQKEQSRDSFQLAVKCLESVCLSRLTESHEFLPDLEDDEEQEELNDEDDYLCELATDAILTRGRVAMEFGAFELECENSGAALRRFCDAQQYLFFGYTMEVGPDGNLPITAAVFQLWDSIVSLATDQSEFDVAAEAVVASVKTISYLAGELDELPTAVLEPFSSLLNTFKSLPGDILDQFNERIPTEWSSTIDEWTAAVDGSAG